MKGKPAQVSLNSRDDDAVRLQARKVSGLAVILREIGFNILSHRMFNDELYKKYEIEKGSNIDHATLEFIIPDEKTSQEIKNILQERGVEICKDYLIKEEDSVKNYGVIFKISSIK
jgi:hypothetical protein